jgi:hypothetical protein
MKYREQDYQGDWARDVPQPGFQGPYEDYGWEPHQSVLPEFRDPTVHFTPEEQKRLASWRRSQEMRWANRPGPHSGKGPRNYVRSDEQIYEDVCERMTRHGELDASNIEVKVQNNEVTLTGDVPDRMSKRLAEDISDSVQGVRDVHNRLQIRAGSGTPERWVDRAGGSGVYPASEADRSPRDSETQGMASWGQGERGAEGYNDHGESEIQSNRSSRART